MTLHPSTLQAGCTVFPHLQCARIRATVEERGRFGGGVGSQVQVEGGRGQDAGGGRRQEAGKGKEMLEI